MDNNTINKAYNNLINLWSDVPQNPPYIAKADLNVMKLNSVKNSKMNFNFDFIPQPFWGNIKNPKVIVLTLNPGYYSKEDYETNERYKQDFINNLKQTPSLNWFNLEKGKDYKWWFNTIKDLLDENITIENIASKIGFFEFSGYHSKSFKSKAYNTIKEINKHEFGIESGILPTQNMMFDLIEALINQDSNKKPLVAIIWGQRFWLQALPTLRTIDYIDTISTTSHLLSNGNIRPIDLKRLKEKLY